MQIVAGIGPFGIRAADSLRGICHVCPRLLDRRNRTIDIGLHAVNVGLRDGDGAYQSGNSPALVGNLSFESCPLRNRSFQGIPKWPGVDFKKEISLLHELVIVHVQMDERAFHLWRDSNEVGEYFAIVGPWIVVRIQDRSDSQSERSNHD